jgi:hypothetical protein
LLIGVAVSSPDCLSRRAWRERTLASTEGSSELCVRQER